jgi:hypothetical protein
MRSIISTSSVSSSDATSLDLPLLQEQRRRMQEAERVLSHRFPKLELRLRKERQLLFRQWKSFFIAAIVLVYFALMVFRNLAYYRFRPGPPLKDLGHQFFPEISDNLELVDFPMYFMFALLAFILSGAFIGHDNPKSKSDEKPYFVNALRRVMIVFACGHTLRAATYLSTSLPGTAKQCRKGSDELDPPPTLASCFTRMVSINGNCGDLNFSGHVFLLVMSILFIHQYGPKFWQYEPNGWKDIVLTSFAIGLAVTQIFLILSSRHHYTVDVVVALYTTPMLWHFFDSKMIDLQPDAGAIETELARESTWPRWLRVVHALASLLLVFVFFFALVLALKGNLRGIAG